MICFRDSPRVWICHKVGTDSLIVPRDPGAELDQQNLLEARKYQAQWPRADATPCMYSQVHTLKVRSRSETSSGSTLASLIFKNYYVLFNILYIQFRNRA